MYFEDLIPYIVFGIGVIVFRWALLSGIAKDLKTKHNAFWWMFFFSIPIGAIIALLWDIKDKQYTK